MDISILHSLLIIVLAIHMQNFLERKVISTRHTLPSLRDSQKFAREVWILISSILARVICSRGFSSIIMRLHSDQVKEYERLGSKNPELQKTYSPTYTLELNSIAECIDRTNIDAAMSMLNESELSHSLCPYAVKYFLYVKSRIPHSRTKLPPLMRISDTKPSLKYARVFGCTAFMLNQPRGTKLDPRSSEGIFLEAMECVTYKIFLPNSAPTIFYHRV